MTHNEMIAVIQAHREGKKIECRIADEGAARLVHQTGCRCKNDHREWSEPCNEPPRFSFGLFDYRVKPEPRELWLAPTGTTATGLREYVDAGSTANASPFCDVIHVREVLE